MYAKTKELGPMGGGHAPGTPPLDPPMHGSTDYSFLSLFTFQQFYTINQYFKNETQAVVLKGEIINTTPQNYSIVK